MMDPADRNRVFVTDLAAERPRLSEANVMRFDGPATADDAGLRGDESAMLFIAQTDGLRRNAASDDYRCQSGRLMIEGLALLLQAFGA